MRSFGYPHYYPGTWYTGYQVDLPALALSAWLVPMQAPQCFTGLTWLSSRQLATLLFMCVWVPVCTCMVHKKHANCNSLCITPTNIRMMKHAYRQCHNNVLHTYKSVDIVQITNEVFFLETRSGKQYLFVIKCILHLKSYTWNHTPFHYTLYTWIRHPYHMICSNNYHTITQYCMQHSISYQITPIANIANGSTWLSLVTHGELALSPNFVSKILYFCAIKITTKYSTYTGHTRLYIKEYYDFHALHADLIDMISNFLP